MISIAITPDRFSGFQSASASSEVSKKADRTVRRPTRGINIKEDTYATLRVVTGTGEEIALADAGGKDGFRTFRTTNVYSNFLLQGVVEQRAEKTQIIETFGEPYIFFFGERPRMVTFSGVLLNTFDFNWEAEWWYNYELYLRGTRCVENDARVFLSYDETLVSGYIVSTDSSKTSQDKNFVTFQFTMFLTGYSNFSDVGNGTSQSAREIEVGRQLAALEMYNSGRSTAALSPATLLPGQTLSGSVTNNTISSPNLAQGLMDTFALSNVLATWNSAKALVNTAAQMTSNLARGDVLRLPYGASGNLAYDNVDLARVKMPTGNYGPLSYSEFNQNTDEYVGSSSHYEGATIKVSFGKEDSSVAQDQTMVDDFLGDWLNFGLTPVSGDLPHVSDLLTSSSLGIFSVGNTSNWRSSAPVDQGLSALNLTPSNAVRAATGSISLG